MKPVWAVFVFCAMAGGAVSLQGQTGGRPVTFNPTQVNLVTSGGVTYAQYTWAMGGCLTVSNIGPLTVEGPALSFDFEIAMETGVACPDDVFMESATVVLGALAPGPRALVTTSWGSPVTTNVFNVPTNSPPMLQPLALGADGSFQMQLTGVPNVGYVLQSSTDLSFWTSLSTNYMSGSTMILTNSTSAGPQPSKIPPIPAVNFFRALVPQTVYLQP